LFLFDSLQVVKLLISSYNKILLYSSLAKNLKTSYLSLQTELISDFI